MGSIEVLYIIKQRCADASGIRQKRLENSRSTKTANLRKQCNSGLLRAEHNITDK